MCCQLRKVRQFVNDDLASLDGDFDVLCSTDRRHGWWYAAQLLGLKEERWA
jgi:hypothetical protein